MSNKRKTSKSTLAITERRRQVVNLRKQGKGLEEIAIALEPAVGRRLSVGTIHKDITES